MTWLGQSVRGHSNWCLNWSFVLSFLSLFAPWRVQFHAISSSKCWSRAAVRFLSNDIRAMSIRSLNSISCSFHRNHWSDCYKHHLHASLKFKLIFVCFIFNFFTFKMKRSDENVCINFILFLICARDCIQNHRYWNASNYF